MIKAEYIWLDGNEPTQQLRSKTKVVVDLMDCWKEWSFDGSSTNQASGHDSDLILKPVRTFPDPIRGKDSYIVLCEVYNSDGKTPHPSNTRAQLRDVLMRTNMNQDPWGGFEQEYVLFNDERPLGFPVEGAPAPQGPYYCSVGADFAYGRHIAEEHLQACLDAGLMIHGINAEVMPGQWEFQIGFRGDNYEDPRILNTADELWVARYLLGLIAEKYGIAVEYHPKPVSGDWNGSGMHTNFSTKATRSLKKGMRAIMEAIAKLEPKHHEHMAQYGAYNEMRLTGKHETCSIEEFKSGAADRGCSIRIPGPVAKQGYGYFEDRRPAANANPYDVARMLVKTILGD